MPSCGEVRRPPPVPLVTPGVVRAAAQDEDVAITAGVQYPLGHVHGKLGDRLDLGVGLHAVQRQPEIERPLVELYRLVLPDDAPPVVTAAD